MGMGVSLCLVALGAILAFAVDADVNALDMQTSGGILMVVGALGLVLSFLLANGSPRRRRTERRDDVVR